MLFCRVALQGPNGETLGGWVDDSLVSLGAKVFVEQDTTGRVWTVTDMAPNLMLESQVQAEHRLAVSGIAGTMFRTAGLNEPAQATKRPRKLKSAQAEAN